MQRAENGASRGVEERDPAGAAFGRLARAWHRGGAAPGDAVASMTPETFRATVAERLRALEREVGEVRARVNGLLFLVAGAVITQIVLRVAGG